MGWLLTRVLAKSNEDFGTLRHEVANMPGLTAERGSTPEVRTIASTMTDLITTRSPTPH
ncbi:MAG: hypothetical protein KDA57_18500 [Planctomycetales bacterium]|nr:hypothetical protein [Planctomycetales bacterium]